MIVCVPFHLLRRQRAGKTAALLLLSNDARELVNLCGHIGADPITSIFPVTGGFLVIPDAVPDSLLPRTIRLRRISENCFVPVDADLVPALHSTEAADLTRQRGLVFLPNNKCLAFDPEAPVPPTSLLRVPIPKLADYQPLPQVRRLAERLTLITCVTPEITPEEILDAGGEGIGEEAPSRPPSVNPVKTAGGKMTFRLGASLAALGAKLGIGALARLGQNLVRKSASAVPRLSESVLGRQAAALNELLRKFREGKIEEALRHALPMGNEPGGSVSSSDQLPTHDTRYSLSNLFGSGGRASLWFGGGDLQRELREEYRKAAQAALTRGDYRRAAFIYGKLLGDLSAAASVLAQGGLHRDAAILYRDRLRQPRQAAQEFEAAGECDEALRLFRQLGDHEAAGDLLNRMGEPEQAIAEYHEAASKIINGNFGFDYLKAGDLMLRKTGRADLAGGYFALGWRERDNPRANYAGNVIPCATRLAEIYAFGDTLEPFWTLIDEVEDWLKPTGNASSAANFFNAVVRLGDLPHLVANRMTLRDRSKLALAAKLREQTGYESRLGNAVGELFGNSGLWSPAIVSDADFAARSALKRKPAHGTRPRPIGSMRLGSAEVTAAVQAPESAEIFVGFVTGAVLAFDPKESRVSQIAAPDARVVEGLAVDARGRLIAAAVENTERAPSIHLHSYLRNEREVVFHRNQCRYECAWHHLSPLIVENIFVSTPIGIVEFMGANLVRREPAKTDSEACAVYLVLPNDRRAAGVYFQMINTERPVIDSGATYPIHPDPTICRIVVEDRAVNWSGKRVNIGWQPQAPTSNFPQLPLAWLQTAVDQIEIAGISYPGILNWSALADPAGSNAAAARSLAFGQATDFRAVTIWKPGRIVGITARNWIYWLRASGTTLEEWTPPTRIPFPTEPVAIFPSRTTEEVIVVLKNGELVRVPMRS